MKPPNQFAPTIIKIVQPLSYAETQVDEMRKFEFNDSLKEMRN